METFFTSDTHYYHEAVLRFARNTRRGMTAEEMNELLIYEHNSYISPEDTVWHLGDFSFGNFMQTCEVVKRLNGKINVILGNHDKVIRDNVELQKMFHSVQEMRYLPFQTKAGPCSAALCHFPMYEWWNSHRGSFHLHGHCHGKINGHFPNWRVMDVGIDGRPDNEMRPWHIDEIYALLNARESRPFGTARPVTADGGE
jgi:calcineurin-like phosphoesterase family protein